MLFRIEYFAEPNLLCVVKKTIIEKHVMYISIQHSIFCAYGFFLDQNTVEQLELRAKVLHKEALRTD